MDWLDAIETEMRKGREAQREGNAGKLRTAARRAVGIAVTELQKQAGRKQYGADAMRQLLGVAEDELLPVEVRESAGRLHARIAQDFTSPSREPLRDAQVIIDFIKQSLIS